MKHSRHLATWMICAALFSASAQSLDKERKFLVKLRTPIGSQISKAGDAVSASIISPESFLGGTLQGTVDRVSNTDNGTVAITFRALVYKGRTFSITSTTTGFVNSKGHKAVDDEERPTVVDHGAFVSPAAVFWLDEGAEVNLLVAPTR